MTLKKYRPISKPIVAVQINVETGGLTYQKWGGAQMAKQGDWLVNNQGECYSIDADSFTATYSPVGGMPGNYVKTGEVWAEQAQSEGHIETKEGRTAYATGDMIVYNGPDLTNGYAMPLARFVERYEPAD